MNMINIAKLGIAIGKYVAGNPELVAKVVMLTVKAIERISGINVEPGSRSLEDESLVENIVNEYNA